MIKIASIFFFILSTIFLLKHIIQFAMILRDENPKPMTVSKVNEVIIYVAISYIITFLITI